MIVGIFNIMIPSMMIFVFGFFGFLHSWLNLWGELLQFGDREFYKDWRNSNSFPEYYRKWNEVVYDWLYAYGTTINDSVYVDSVLFLESVGIKKGGAKRLSALFVLQFSAFMHEVILACAFGCWYIMI